MAVRFLRLAQASGLRTRSLSHRFGCRRSPLRIEAARPLMSWFESRWARMIRTGKNELFEVPGVADLAGGSVIPSRLARINRGASRCSLAVKGDALIYGPNLVAWSVVSERRNHHPHQVKIQTQLVTK